MLRRNAFLLLFVAPVLLTGCRNTRAMSAPPPAAPACCNPGPAIGAPDPYGYNSYGAPPTLGAPTAAPAAGF